MSSIQSLGISGIRGYTPDNFQMIEFMKPLTLIWGKNGSGKTTIIECLKYITTGSLPPNSDKGKSFIMDNKVAGKPQVIGDIRFIFNVGNRPILAKRRIQLSAKGQQLKFQSIQQLLKTKGQKNQDLTINHQCAQIEKQVPQFLGISKPILQNIVFCHQDESLWPFGDSLLLKNIFDELFETKKITKQMERIWDIIKDQQGQLKQQKIRIEYLRQTYKKQIQERSKHFIELEEVEIKSRELKGLKRQINKLSQGLRDNSEKIKQREKLIYKKGRIENSIANFQAKLKSHKENIYRIDREFEQKTKGHNIDMGMQENSYGFSSRSNSFSAFGQNNTAKLSNAQLQKVKVFYVQTAEKSIQELEQKKSLYESLKQQYKAAKQQHQNLKNFTESSKRQQEIKSQIDRVKSLIPELKYNKDIKNQDDFVRCLKEYVNELQQKMKGKQMAKRQLEKMQIPVVVQTGFSDKEVDELRRQSKQLQSDIKVSTFTILKIYQNQFKENLNDSKIQRSLVQLDNMQKQLQNTEAILKSKRQELQHYLRMQQDMPQQKDKKSLQQDYNHYKYAGIELQQQMLHFCEKKGKCYFCSKQMTKKQIQGVRAKVSVIKKKTEEKLLDLQNKIQNQSQQTVIDPQVMVRKLTQEVGKLQSKLQLLRAKVSTMQEVRSHEKQAKLNKILIKQLQRCNLKVQMLQKLTNIDDRHVKQQQYYKEYPTQEFVEMCAQHQIKLTRYKGVKDQITKLQTNQQRNQLNRVKRQQVLQQRKELEVEIMKTQEQLKHFDFLKNSLVKLEPLVKMEAKSKQRKATKQGVRNNNNNSGQQSSSYQMSFSSVQEASCAINRLYVQILQQKVYIQKLQISITYHNDKLYLQQQKQQYYQLIHQLQKLTTQLKTSEQLLNQYNTAKLSYEKQAQRLKHKLGAITQIINQPLQNNYLITLNKIKHLQTSINNLELHYSLMEEAVSDYHSQKMQEINQYIYQVWREIYHGEDIEYIEIEASTDQGSKKKKKNYQYKILMKKSTKNFKNQQKVEMKGRCSTGQKVLASIVIRLALAEVFCGSTRILALDQPTTNLDRQHIINLANALLKLIELSGGKNFQLIIISHDIQFIQMLESYADTYYQVKRDQNRFSTIQKKLIREIYKEKKPVS